jgi:hypothetical protein
MLKEYNSGGSVSVFEIVVKGVFHNNFSLENILK